MKKILSFFALAALLLTASCSKQESPVLGDDQVIISLGLEGVSATRAISDGSKVNQLVYEVYDKNGALLGTMDETTEETVTFPYSLSLPLAKGQDYTILFWAQNSGCEAYNTEDLRSVTVDYTDATNNDETRDAFYAAVNVHVTGGPQKVDVVLKRPFAQVNVAVPQAEWQRAIDAGVEITASAATFSTEVATVINLQDGTVSTPSTVTYALNNLPNEDLVVNEVSYKYLSMSYILVGEQKSMVNNATFTFNSNVNAVTLSVPNLPVQRNYRTNVLGTFLVDYVDFNIVVDPIYNTPDEVYPDTDIENLQYAAKNGGEVTLSNNVVLDEPLTIQSGKYVVINLNGKKISATDESTASYAVITNKGDLTVKGPGTISLTATNNRGWNAYSSVISNTVGGNLTVEGGVLIEHLGGTDMAYGIDNLTNGKGTSAIATINKAEVRSTYRAVRQFLNGIEAYNELYVNKDAVISAPNKGIWMQDPSAKANTGKLVVAEGAKVDDIYLTVTAGSTEWPVEVSIAASSLNDGKQVLTSNVPNGYVVACVGGIWTVLNNATKVSTEDELNEAIASGVTNIVLSDGQYDLPSILGKDITFIGSSDAEITINKPNMSGSNITFDGVKVKGSGYATGVQHVNTVTYKNVTVIGEMCLYGENASFTNCTFELTNQYIWVYGCKVASFDKCTFNTNGKAILVYNEGAGANDVTVRNCTFNATAGAKAGAIANQNCAAIEIDNFQSSGVGAAHKVTTSNNTVANNFSGEWRIKNYVNGNPINVNGVDYTSLAIDGKLMTIDGDKNVTVK
ncbi:MAG: hypothetical protein J6V29_02050 [Bacteroidales bacterium]|nr:hypothetical protein [Bacteroidales bacterium]